jgi:WD40 repeat protein
MGAILDLYSLTLAYNDAVPTSNPELRSVDWKRAFKGIEVRNPKTDGLTIPAGVEKTIFDGTRPATIGGSTFSLSLSPLEPDRYRITHNFSSATWTQLAHQIVKRSSAATILMNDGRILAAGGFTDVGVSATAETYTPFSSWQATASMVNARYLGIPVMLNDGTVLVIGGFGVDGLVLNSVEKYDPNTNTWSAAASLNVARAIHSAIKLPNGKVLVLGGTTDEFATNSVEIYDPNANTWTVVSPMSSARSGLFTQTVLLPNGRVLVFGGSDETTNGLTSAEVYNPTANTWAPAGSMSVIRRAGASAVVMQDGKVLVAGGHSGSAHISDAEIFDPSSSTWTVVASTLETHYTAGIVLLTDGRVLILGGSSSGNGAETYDSISGEWHLTPAMAVVPRYFFSTIQLADGRVLAIGGQQDAGFTDTVEMYTVGTDAAFRVDRNLDLSSIQLTLVVQTNGSLKITAGTGTPFSSLQAGDEVFIPGTSTGDIAGAFNVLNEGFWSVLATGSSGANVTLIRSGDFSGYGEVVTPSAPGQLIGFAADGVQEDDKIELSAGFAPAARRTFNLVAVTSKWVEFKSSTPLAAESGIAPGSSGIKFYTDEKRFVQIEVDQDATVRLNGDTGSTLKLSPWWAGDPKQVATMIKVGPVWSLKILNTSSQALHCKIISAE